VILHQDQRGKLMFPIALAISLVLYTLDIPYMVYPVTSLLILSAWSHFATLTLLVFDDSIEVSYEDEELYNTLLLITLLSISYFTVGLKNFEWIWGLGAAHILHALYMLYVYFQDDSDDFEDML